MEKSFFDSIAHARPPLIARLRGRSAHVVLGARLRPFYLWHEALLDSIESPFLRPPEAPGENEVLPDRKKLFLDLFLATEICRLKFPRLPRAGNWLAKLRRKIAFVRFYRRGNLYRLLAEAARFRVYLRDYNQRPIPIFWHKADSETVKSPRWLYDIALYLRFNPRLKLRRAWNTPPTEIAWQNIAGLEAHGSRVSVASEAQVRAFLKAQTKQMIADPHTAPAILKMPTRTRSRARR